GRGHRSQARPPLLDLPADAVTVRPLPRSRLDALVPSLVTGQALVALVPATGDLKWAAGAAWDVARAAALADRRIALVDLWLEHPTLHETVGLAPTEGIVDAFEYDVSLTKAAHQVDRVFFIAAGTVTAHAGDLFANPRWKKLHGGFRVENALLLLYLSAGAAGGWGLLARGAEQRRAPAPVPAAPVRARPVAAAPAPRVDSLAWTVQLAAYARLDKALALADRLAADGVAAFVTPMALDDRRGSAVWYRVLAGAFPTRDAALGGRTGMWKQGLAARGQGDVLRAPYSFSLSDRAPAVGSLRARGIPAVPWGAGSRLLAGAFETPEQASLLEARLKRAGVQATLVTRMGTPR